MCSGFYIGGNMSDLEYMEIAYQEALKAYEKDEVPIGAIIVKDDQIIARSYNLKENKQMVTRHAEINVIEEAERILGNWYLDECTLYTTLEPCLMCSGAIIQSRIKRVVFGASDTRWASLTKVIRNEKVNHHPDIYENIYMEECSTLLKKYFKEKRKQK